LCAIRGMFFLRWWTRSTSQIFASPWTVCLKAQRQQLRIFQRPETALAQFAVFFGFQMGSCALIFNKQLRHTVGYFHAPFANPTDNASGTAHEQPSNSSSLIRSTVF
jgi:hypothetical protein